MPHAIAAPSPRLLVLRERAAWLSDLFAAGVAAALPWSTSATSILIGLWLVSVIPALNWETVRRAITTPAGATPVLLWFLALIGMLWADVSWHDRLHGLDGFHKLLLIPLLLARYLDGGRSHWVLMAYFISCSLLLVASGVISLRPDWKFSETTTGVVVKDYITQSGEFVLCAFGLFGAGIALPPTRRRLALSCAALGSLFLADVFYIATGRTALVVIVVLALLFAFWNFGWRRIIGPYGWRAFVGLIATALVGCALWFSSATLRSHLSIFWSEVEQYRSESAVTRAGERLEFWRKSSAFVAEAPLIGHGTGSIAELFRRSAAGQIGVSGVATDNPHNQLFAVAIQLGLLGAVLLLALWIAHLRIFWAGEITAWLGLIVVVQNIASSLFNSHLFDFSQGWTYVFSVGVVGGLMMRHASALNIAPTSTASIS